jgi:hypothetical protein
MIYYHVTSHHIAAHHTLNSTHRHTALHHTAARKPLFLSVSDDLANTLTLFLHTLQSWVLRMDSRLFPISADGTGPGDIPNDGKLRYAHMGMIGHIPNGSLASMFQVCIPMASEHD